MLSNDDLLTEQQLADLLAGASPNTLRKWRTTKSGPPYIKLGRSVRYRRSDVDQWLTERTIVANPRGRRS